MYIVYIITMRRYKALRAIVVAQLVRQQGGILVVGGAAPRLLT